MTNSTLSALPTYSCMEQQLIDNYLPQCNLKWRQGQLLVNLAQQSQYPYIYIAALESEQWLVECLKNSPVRLVQRDPSLGETALKHWADACEQANKPLFFRGGVAQKPSRRQGGYGWQPKQLQLTEWMAAFLLLIALSPVMLATAILMSIYSPGPIFSLQWRIGSRGKFFRLLKFRTTVSSDDSGTTPLGRWMRKYSLDELPQLFNVLRGELSWLGRSLTVFDAVQFSLEDQRQLRLSLETAEAQPV